MSRSVEEKKSTIVKEKLVDSDERKNNFRPLPSMGLGLAGEEKGEKRGCKTKLIKIKG